MRKFITLVSAAAWNRLQEGLQIVGDDIDITIQIEANTPRQR